MYETQSTLPGAPPFLIKFKIVEPNGQPLIFIFENSDVSSLHNM